MSALNMDVTWPVLGLLVAGACCVSCATLRAPHAPSRVGAAPERLAIGRERAVPSPDGLGQRLPAVAYGDGVYLLVWREGFGGFQGRSRIVALLLDDTGRPLGQGPIAISDGQGLSDYPAVAYCAGNFLVAWTSRPAAAGGNAPYRLHLRRVDARGHWAAAVAPLAGPTLKIKPALASNGSDEFMLVWQEYRDGYFAVLGARVAAATGKLIDQAHLQLMTRQGNEETAWAMADSLGIAWTGAGYAVAQSGCAMFLDPKGNILLPRTPTWEAEAPGGQAVVAAWNRGFVFHCARPHPDPWGWYGNGVIVGLSVTSEGAGDEQKMLGRLAGDVGKPREYALLADGHLANCLDAARWLNHPGWPMGIPGGLRHTVDDVWPSGPPAAAFNGESLLVVWPRGQRVDNRRIVNRDLYLTRLLPGWRPVDPLPVPVAADAVEENNPVMCAGRRGRTLLAYEKLTDSGVAVRYRMLVEQPDRRAPSVAHVSPLSNEELIVTFAEAVAPASIDRDRFSIDGWRVNKVEFNPDARAKGREVILTVDPPEIGRRYVLRVDGVTDCSPAANVMQRRKFRFLARPGTVQHCPRVYQWDNPNSSELHYDNPDRTGSRDFICNWLLLGPVPGGLNNRHPCDPATVMPAPGEQVVTDAGVLTWSSQEGEAVDLGARMGKKSNHSAYAATYVYAEAPLDVLLRLDSNDHNRAWLNGRLVNDGIGAGAGPRVFHDYTDTVPVRLRRGWNRLLVQVHNHGGWWMMVAQITDSEGRPLRFLTWQNDRPTALATTPWGQPTRQ